MKRIVLIGTTVQIGRDIQKIFKQDRASELVPCLLQS